MRQFDVPVKTVTRRKLDELSERGSHQGVMAEARPYRYASFKDILRNAQEHAEANDGNALVVVLGPYHRRRKPRRDRAFGRDHRRVGAHHSQQAQRACDGGHLQKLRGAINPSPARRFPNLAATLDKLKEEGFCGRRQRAGHYTVWGAPLHGSIVLVMGNEATAFLASRRKLVTFSPSSPQARQGGIAQCRPGGDGHQLTSGCASAM